MIKYIISIIGICCLPLIAQAQQWVAVGGRGAQVELDRASVITAGEKTQAWTRTTQPRQILGPEDGFFYRRLVQLNEYQCGDRTYAALQKMYFNDAGLLVKEQRVSDAEDLERIIPGTPEDRMYKMVCPAESLAQSPENRIKNDVRDRNARSGTQSSVAAVAPGTSATQPAQTNQTAATAAKPATPSATAQTATKAPVGQKPAQTAATAQRGTGMAAFLSRLLPSRATPQQRQSAAVAVTPARKPATTLGQVDPQLLTPSATAQQPASRPATKQPASTPVEQAPATSAAQKPQTVAQNTRPAAKPAEPAAVQQPVNSDIRPTDTLPWLYSNDSTKGPAKWGSLSSANKLCSTGLMQAPIDIRNPVVADMDPIRFDAKPTQLKIMDTGNTIMVKVDPGLSLTWQGVKYDLLYYTFHAPSEIHVDGKAYDMSIHFVHRSLQGKVTVLAVPVKIGKENPAIRQIWNNLPLEAGIEMAPNGVVVNPRDIIDAPDSISDVAARSAPQANRLKGYYVFVGSLSTPPCTEGVLWLALKEPVEISQEQMSAFTRLYRNNVRPIQATRGRLIKSTRY